MRSKPAPQTFSLLLLAALPGLELRPNLDEQLPFRWSSRFSAEGLGSSTVQYEKIETHLDVAGNLFSLDPVGPR